MTEFRRASTILEALEARVAALLSDESVKAGSASAEALAQFVDARSKVSELVPTADKMRRKCDARAELEVVKGKLREMLPGAPEESVKVAQEAVDAEAANAEALKPLLSQAHALEGVATYGAKMVEKILDLLGRLDAAKATLEADLAPRLAVAADAGVAAAEAQRAEEARQKAAEEAEEFRRAQEADLQEKRELMAGTEARLQAAQAREAEERRRQEEEAQKAREAEQARLAEEEMLQRAEEEGEARLKEVGPDAAAAEALAALLVAPVGLFRIALEDLHGMIGGVASEPMDFRFRVIRAANDRFQERVGRRPGAWLFLRAVGYELRAREALPSGLLASLGISSGHPSERFLYLTEPNMMEEYEAWNAWHERIKKIASCLEELGKLTFSRSAHLGRHGQDVQTQTLLSAGEVLSRWEAHVLA